MQYSEFGANDVNFAGLANEVVSCLPKSYHWVWCNAERGVMTITVESPVEQGKLIDLALNTAMENSPGTQPGYFFELWLSAEQLA